MEMKAFRNTRLSALGLGNMRLPAKNPKDPKSPIDWPAAHEIMRYAMENGINYYDTAYVYNGGESEACVGEGMKNYPRDSFYLATKFNYRANPDYKEVFETQLKRLQTDHIDFYLLHCLLDSNIEDYLNCGCIEYFLEQKALGRIRWLGFSSHASVETLTRFADHHDWDFAQIQLNYFDWNYSTTAREYQVLKDRNIPIVVMEPVRGGRLAKLTPEAESILKTAHPDWSTPSWALRFASSLPGIQVVLSGMSNMEQIRDNISTFSDGYCFTEADREILMKACDLFHSQLVIPCTGCRYCCDDCPMQINIPDTLTVYNSWKTGHGGIESQLKTVSGKGSFKDCVGCGACTGHCPQSIDVPAAMAELKDKFGHI